MHSGRKMQVSGNGGAVGSLRWCCASPSKGKDAVIPPGFPIGRRGWKSYGSIAGVFSAVHAVETSDCFELYELCK